MKPPPFLTFNGFLKQHAHERLSALEQELFDLLFPAFQGTSDAESSFEEARTSPLWFTLNPFIDLVQGETRPRRFSGFGLARSRYFALCRDASGDDSQTLAHELRAYRAPVPFGMVEVLDLARGYALCIGDLTVQLEPQPAIAVLVHEPQLLPTRFHTLAFRRVPGLKDNEIFIYRFPYHVIHRSIKQTIDLRFPEVQDWFYRSFRDLSDVAMSCQAHVSGIGELPTIAHSRFNFENGLSPTPDSFWSMLPTLMNPELGGGSPADTGSTLVMVGHWMRQNRAAALIFPSARCDAAAVFQDGALRHWQGWNLVDYGDCPMFGLPNTKVVTFVSSPWAWVSLPCGVRIHVAGKDSRLAGSFAVENMVNYWAQDYLGQLRALEIARSAHGREPPYERRSATNDLDYRAFAVGALSLRWVRMLVQRSAAEEIEQAALELQGLALPHGMY